MKYFANTLWSLWQQWWQVDRLRASPRDGRLLRIQPGSYLRIGSELVAVVSRSVEEDQAGAFLVYYGQSGQASCSLRVSPLNGSRCLLCWTNSRASAELEEGEIEVFRSPIGS